METDSTEMEKEASTPKLELITHVQVEPAHQNDAHALIPALEAMAERGLESQEVLADSLYGGDEDCEATEALGVEVVCPVMGPPNEKALLLFPQGDDFFDGRRLMGSQGRTAVINNLEGRKGR
jgi:hypothetical protein